MSLLSQWELWACANQYIVLHGEDAALIAAQRCDELFEAGDFRGVRNFHAIIEHINRLLEAPSGTMH